MMAEPTETVSKNELDAMIEGFKRISEEAYSNPESLRNSPTATSVTRIDEAKANRPKTMQLRWNSNP